MFSLKGKHGGMSRNYYQLRQQPHLRYFGPTLPLPSSPFPTTFQQPPSSVNYSTAHSSDFWGTSLLLVLYPTTYFHILVDLSTCLLSSSDMFLHSSGLLCSLSLFPAIFLLFRQLQPPSARALQCKDRSNCRERIVQICDNAQYKSNIID